MTDLGEYTRSAERLNHVRREALQEYNSATVALVEELSHIRTDVLTHMRTFVSEHRGKVPMVYVSAQDENVNGIWLVPPSDDEPFAYLIGSSCLYEVRRATQDYDSEHFAASSFRELNLEESRIRQLDLQAVDSVISAGYAIQHYLNDK